MRFLDPQNVENVLTPDGFGLVTALRVLCQVACPPPTVEGKTSKHNVRGHISFLEHEGHFLL